MSHPKIVRCAVIGLGMGRNHCKSLHECEDAELVAFADLDESRHSLWGDVVGKQGAFTDYKEMLEKVQPDVVTIALPNVLHAQVTLDALEAGAHVLCEKPMAMNVAEAKAMKEKAEEKGLTLGINLSYRFSPQSRALKKMAESGFLGQSYHGFTRWTRMNGIPGKFGGWFGQKAIAGGGSLIDLGVHRIDLALWLMGNPEPTAVSCVTHKRFGMPSAKKQGSLFDVEDLASGIIRFKDGQSLLFEVSWDGYQREKEMMATRIMGDKGTLVQRNLGGKYEFVAEFIRHEADQIVKGSIVETETDLRDPYAEFAHCVRHGKPYLAMAEDGLRMQKILDALYESAEKGCEVTITCA